MLTARHALCPVVRVSAAKRPPAQQAETTVYAVLTPDDDPAGAGRFLGLVTSSQTASYHERIFADLLPRPAPAPVAEQTPLNDVVTHLDREKAEAVAVLDEGGAFLGAVTRVSLLDALLQGEPAPGVTTAPIEGLHSASLHLLSLLALHEKEQDLLQPAIETLTALLKARYGAVGILDEHGQLRRFVHTGITPELAARIGRLPEGRGLLGVVIAENHALRLDDMSRDPRSVGFPPHHPPMKSLLAVPISRDGRVYGRVYFSDRLDGAPFSADDERLATQAADVLGLTLSHHHLQNERRQAADTLHDIAQVLSANAGESLFHKLVLSLAKALGVDSVFVGEVSPHNAGIIQTIAFCDHGRIVDNIEYPLTPATACGSVGCQTVCYFPEGVRKLYPEDEILREFHAEAFIGHPLIDSAGRLLGLLAVMHAKPLANPGQIQSILQISAVRAVAELERQHAEAELRKLSSAIEQTADSVIITDPNGVIEYVNPAFEQTTGYHRAEVLGGKPSLLKSSQHDQAFYERLWATIKRGEPFREVFINRRKNGTLYYEEKTITPLKDDKGQITHFVSTGKDITERRLTEDQVARLGRILERSSNEIYVFDAATLKFTQVNQGALKNLGYTLDELRGLTAVDLMPTFTPEQFRELIEPLRRGDEETLSFETMHKRKDGSLYPVEVCLQFSSVETPPVFVAIISDITERRQAQERLNYLAFYDTLTGLPNRLLLLDRIRQATLESGRHERLVAIMYLDLDRFKLVNDTLGHEAGDLLLKSVAGRLSNCVRPGDTVARLGGDEFVVVLANVAHVDDVGRVAQKTLDVFARPFLLAGQELFVSPSVGITLYPFDDKDPESLLKNADAAMYHAKDSGRNTFQFFTPELNARAARRLGLETALRHALERDEFVLHYQPQVDLASGRVIGMEALIRWQRPETGMVSPLEFIPLAEETGLIVPIGEWVLRTACAQNQAWQMAGLPALRMSVNIAARQFQQQNLTEVVARILQETGLDPRWLTLEITESTVMRNAGAAIETLQQIGALGVGLSVDDFGTGYSSLSYLNRFPLDYLKIDKSFIDDITTDPNDAATAIATAIISMAGSLGIKVVAEGVETLAQLNFLRARGCDTMQGYYFSKPLPAAALASLLAEGTRLEMGPAAAPPHAGKKTGARTMRPTPKRKAPAKK